MKTASLTAAMAAFLVATPAFATSTIHCRTRAGGPDIWLVLPNERGAGIDQARIVHGREEIVTGRTRSGPWISQSAIDPRRINLRVAPGGTRQVILVLNASRRGVPYVGNVTWRGRAWPVRCLWDEDDEE
ncbi:MAG TPA: hypothetical protein VEC11_15505 [Allosphingosinicella sp.]|nr:hypothetical protein [Allosphingosinicella sp.]